MAQESEDEDAPPPFSVYDSMRVPPERRSVRRLPALTWAALRLVDRAGRGELVASGVLQLIAGVGVGAQLFAAHQVLGHVIAQQDSGSDASDVVPSLVLLAVISAGLAAATVVQAELARVTAELVAREANEEILDVAGAVDLTAYDTPAFHDRLERARLNAHTRPLMAVNGLFGLLSAVIGSVAVVLVLFALHPLLVPLTTLALVPMWVATTRNSRSTYASAVRLTPVDRERGFIGNVLSSRDMAKEVRAFAINPFLRSRYDNLYARRIEEVRGLARRRMVRGGFASLVGSMSAAGTIALLVWLLAEDRMTLAEAGTAVPAIIFLGQRLRSMVNSAGSLYESSLFIEDVNLFLELKPTVRAAQAHHEPQRFTLIEAHDVSFWYPGSKQPALDGVSFRIGRGEIVALVGENGSGKTTLAKLLGQLYQPSLGRITWDGVDSEALDTEHLRRSIAVIFQDFGHYWLSARDNIAIGDTGRLDDLDGIRAAAVAAGADEFISRFPRGYETILSRLFEGGRELSIGQWQRIALARALFREAPLVIMDEPTSALDPLAESELFSHIRELAVGRSVLLISHRFSSVRSADRIYVLADGRVVEEGTHDQLMAADARYARMFSLQASAYLGETRGVDPA